MSRLNILPDHDEEQDATGPLARGRFPSWLHRKLPEGNALWKTQSILNTHRMPTVCEEAKCPNLLECWSKKTATFLTMGKECTRKCGFCSIDFTKAPQPPQQDEPQRIALSVKELGLKHVVLTMVARDDLSDGGAKHLVYIIEAIRKENDSTVEVLTSDFNGNLEALQVVLRARPEIFNHNIETVRSLTPRVRHRATYERTLMILQHASQERSPSTLIKSGIMVGLGESEKEVEETLQDLKNVGCHIVTIGQYLQPHRHKLRVKSFITPSQFEAFAAFGKKIGLQQVYAGPFVRSSYNAATVFEIAKKDSIYE